MKDKSGLTAICRKNISRPAKYLLDNNLLYGKILDYGCGRGQDVEKLKYKGFDVNGFDPNQTKWQNINRKYKYDIILCSYVLNVVEHATRIYILQDIKKLLKISGKAYITVRRDIKQDYISSKGTCQYVVKLDLPILKETSDYCIYQL